MSEIKDLKLEEAMALLEATAEKMEGGDLPLEDMVRLYKEGMNLAKHCEGLLDQADKELIILEQEMEDHE